MAQAARLNLRMQKELKLLLTDPPPGASFPTLSDDSFAPSLTSIEALFRGPEGTVYANGVFKIKIQIPERYPFQPPIVTFATSIYHPNIDNGGRICLDILNLPPKGTWQPSLNISTVLTCIGLLLSEPNPDDGLMHEASREYKYNRQAFDQKARSMTEKYSTAAESGRARTGPDCQINTGPSTTHTEIEGLNASISDSEHLLYHERFGGSSRKLSLEFPGSSNNRDSDRGIHKVPIHEYSNNCIKAGQLKEADYDSARYNGNPGKVYTTRNKLSLKVSVDSQNRNSETKNIGLPNQCLPPLLDTRITSTDSPRSSVGNRVSHRDEDGIERSCSIKSVSQVQQPLHCIKTSQSRDLDEKPNPPKDAIARKESCFTSTKLEKGLVGPIPSLGPLGCAQRHLEDGKENLAPVQLTEQSAASAMISSVVSETGMHRDERRGKQTVMATLKLPKKAAKLPLQQPLGQHQLLDSNNNKILHSSSHSKFPNDEKQPAVNQVPSTDKFKEMVPEAVIVLDSEDSEDENVPMRSKLSLAKRCLSRKRKSASGR